MKDDIGKIYQDGDLIITEGETGDCMYVIQEGEVEVFVTMNGEEIPLAVRRAGDFFGEMALFEREARSASVRAVGAVRILTLDKRNFLSRINADPSLAYRMVQAMSKRIRELSEEVARLKRDVSHGS